MIRTAGLRHFRKPLLRLRFSSESGENKTGHIEAKPNEGLLFFESRFPTLDPSFTDDQMSFHCPPIGSAVP